MSMLVNNSKHRTETTSRPTEFRQIEFHRRYVCFHSVDLSTSINPFLAGVLIPIVIILPYIGCGIIHWTWHDSSRI